MALTRGHSLSHHPDFKHLQDVFIIGQTHKLITVLDTLSPVHNRNEYSKLIQVTEPWLPRYKVNGLFHRDPDQNILKGFHKELAFLLTLHPTVQQKHPLFFSHHKVRAQKIGQHINSLDMYEERVEYITPYFYRVSDFSILKKTDSTLVNTMNRLYANDDEFLRNSLHELILVDMIKMSFYPDSKVRISSNVDDRRYGFDAIVMNSSNRLLFIDFTFKTNNFEIMQKKEKITKFISSDTRLFGTEFAVYLYENHGLALNNLKRTGMIGQVNRNYFDTSALPAYLLNSFDGGNISIDMDQCIRFL